MEEIKKGNTGIDEYINKINSIPKIIKTKNIIDIDKIASELQKKLSKKIKI